MVEIILSVVVFFLFVIAYFLYIHKQEIDRNQEDVTAMQKLIDDNITLSTQLYKLYSSLQENQNLQLKAFDLMSKAQKLTSTDVFELREEVSNALVIIVEQLAGTNSSAIETAKLVKDKLKLN